MYSLESPRWGDSNEYTQHTIIIQKIEKTSLNYVHWPGVIINPQWLEVPMSRINLDGPKLFRAIEVRLYLLFIHISTRTIKMSLVNTFIGLITKTYSSLSCKFYKTWISQLCVWLKNIEIDRKSPLWEFANAKIIWIHPYEEREKTLWLTLIYDNHTSRKHAYIVSTPLNPTFI